MRSKLLSVITAAVVAMAVAVYGPASPAHATIAGPPPGYQPPPGYMTTPPESCYVNIYNSGAVTECFRVGGVHLAMAQCANGYTIYGFAEEMQDFKQSQAFCRSGGYYGELVPALYAWGEFYLDW